MSVTSDASVLLGPFNRHLTTIFVPAFRVVVGVDANCWQGIRTVQQDSPQQNIAAKVSDGHGMVVEWVSGMLNPR